jgi:hypothetical protein
MAQVDRAMGKVSLWVQWLDGGGWRFARPGGRVVHGLVPRLAAYSAVMAAAASRVGIGIAG